MKLKISVDGIPIFKSRKTALWPISVTVGSGKPSAVALWYGVSKPSSVEEYLHGFFTEVKHLEEFGYSVNGEIVSARIGSFVCDAPARAFLKGVVHHSGYHSCERCTIHG